MNGPVRPAPARIWLVSYRSSHNGKLVRVMAKVPYGGTYAMTETLTRAVTIGEIAWFRVEPAPSRSITKQRRERLQRWLPALQESSQKTQVRWLM